MKEKDLGQSIQESEPQKPESAKRRISRRLFAKVGLSGAGVMVANALLRETVHAQMGELKPIPGVKPVETPKFGDGSDLDNVTLIGIDSDADSPQDSEQHIYPLEAQQELENTSGVIKNFVPEKVADVKVRYKKGDPIAAHAIVHANINQNTQLVNFYQPEIDVYINGSDPTSLEYAKLVGGMGYGKIINMANNGEAVEQFNAHVKRTANVDLTTEDKRIDDLNWLFDIAHYIKGSQKEYSDISSSASEKLFMHCFSLLQFKKGEVLEKLKKNILDNEKSLADKKRGANIFLSAIETMFDMRKTKVTLAELKLDTVVKELAIMSGRQTSIVGY